MRNNQSQDYLKMMLKMASVSGDIAIKYLNKSSPSLKKDASIITLADKSISKLCHQALKDTLKDPAHLLIDEEDPAIGEYLNQKRLDQSSFIWAIDPIDGTRLYANRMPMFGVSIGLLKDLKPWLGVVYFPMLKELFYCDGKEAYYVQNAFTSKPKSLKIKPINEKLSPKSLFFCNDTFFNKFAWKDKDFHILINACAVVNLCWPSIGRGVGCFLKSHLWDFAGSWPILQRAGLDFRSVKTGKLMDEIGVDLFNGQPKPWELKEYYLISSKENYSQISSKIRDLSSTKKR
jgi:fructose-1,6-bisphosphatase/inositol monophosphatase family enzyme